MKQQIGKIMQRVAAIFLGVLLTLGHVAQAEDNTGTGDIGGDAAALLDSNTFVLFSTGAALTLAKTAFLTSDGTQLTSGATLPQGTMVDFMIYINNQGSVTINDASIQDVLNPLFAYQADSIRVDNSVANCLAAACTPAEEAAIYAVVSGIGAGTDLVDADSVSFNGGNTVNAGDENEANGPLDAGANAVLAVVFRVRVQ